jgi:hypothetical protein
MAIIDSENLPKAYGGKLDWKYEDDPSLDEDAQKAMDSATISTGPLLFKNGKIITLTESLSS